MSRKPGASVAAVPWSQRLSERAKEALSLLLIAFALFSLLSLATFRLPDPGLQAIPREAFQNLGGAVGYHIAHGMTFLFGQAAYLVFAFLLVHAVLLFLRHDVPKVVHKALGVLVFTVVAALLLAGPDGRAGIGEPTPYGAGGRFGANLSPRLYEAFGGSGRILLLVFGGLVAFLIATDFLFLALLRQGAERLGRAVDRIRPDPAAAATAGGSAGAEVLDAGAADLLGPRSTPRRRRASRVPDPAEEAEPGEPEPEAAYEDARPGGGEADVDDRAGAGLVIHDSRPPQPARAVGPSRPEPEPGSGPVAGAAAGAAEPPAAAPESPAEPAEPAEPAPDPDAAKEAGAAPAEERPAARRPRIKVERARRVRRGQQSLPFPAAYPFPPIDLFHQAAHQRDEDLRTAIQANADAIERRLGSFKIEAKVVSVSPGPAVTQYEVRLGEGIKVSRVVSFEADLAAALKATSVRVVAPIPGKDTVGVEVPNQRRQMVVMRELLELHGRAEDLALPLFLGRDVAGKPIVEDLTKMPHILIAGTTGSGKSVCINTILLSLLMTRTPEQVRLILIDPKMVELQSFRAVPHLACDVVTNMKKAPTVLQWAVDEMERRYELFSRVGVNHITLFNRLGRGELEKRLQTPVDEGAERIPYMVVVIDELADLVAVAQNEVEESIQRLAQKSRAVGIHVILATQRPSTDVITGVIKANLPAQIAFRVSRKIDSRVILDANGAEVLLGHGDMLYNQPGGKGIVRAQGTYVAEDEIDAVVKYLEMKGQTPSFIPELARPEKSVGRRPQEKDDLYEKAVEVVLGQQRGSATLLQRALAIGYTRATRLLELMEEDGLVGGFQGSKSREVLMTLEDWRIREESIRDELDRLEQEGAEDGAVEAEEDADADLGGAAAGESGSSQGAAGEDAGSASDPGAVRPSDPEATQEHEAQGP
ncbi:MAG: DNA translocase FtsK [Planctomycetes bacterium]|nr:DNA translocase FtsK [Planctomycetota bacterium]